MVRTFQATHVRHRHSWPETGEADAGNDDIGFSSREVLPAPRSEFRVSADAPRETKPQILSSTILKEILAVSPLRAQLSVRAENVLKELALELTGETPPKGRWIPSVEFLRRLTFRHLSTARNCGPHTIDEITGWAELSGVAIQRPFHAGKSLPAMWRELVAKFSSGEFTKSEIVEALERSARRNNARIPVEVQHILSKLLSSTSDRAL